MDRSHKLKILSVDVMFLSYFGTGFFPKAPGTFGSLCAIPLLIITDSYSIWLQLSIIILFTFLACWRTEILQKKMKLHDPQWIVIDEVLGMLTTALFNLHYLQSWLSILLIFVFFRFFDIIKFWPATYFDKKVHHGAGTILDDIVSGIYAGMTFYLVQIGLKHSGIIS
ncbi:MAG: phosphatidylglycerophosphatase A [Bacteriovoracaceae bacterium]